MTIIGIVLAGGLSRRMGGPDKAFVGLDGRPLLAHVVGRLRPQVESLVVSAHQDPIAFEPFGLPLVRDDVPGFAGPVAGLVAAMDWIAERHPDADHAASCAVDTPFIPSDLVERLRDAMTAAGTDAACAASGGRSHYVAALWRLSARQALRRWLSTERTHRLAAALAAVGHTVAVWPVAPVDPFLNINTPDDFDRAEEVIRAGQGP